MFVDGHPRIEGDPYAGTDLTPDLHRVSNRWLQIIRDMTAAAPMSHWAADVTTQRIGAYDQIRPFVTRGVLLGITAMVLSQAPGTTGLTWLLLLPAAVQVALEIFLDYQVGVADSSRTPLLGPLAKIAEAAHSETLVNVTGVIGVFAVPATIVAVTYCSGPTQPGWPKVLALAAAAAYGASSILSFLTDAAHYSAHQSQTKPYRCFRAVRPHVWLITTILMTAIVGGSITAHRWAPEMVPLAWSLCAFPFVIGMKQRDYERFLRASSEQLPKVQQGAKRALTKDYHNANTDIRTFNRQLAENKSVPAEIRIRAAALAPLISLMYEAIDHEQWVRQQERPSLAGIARKYGSDAALDLTVDVRLDDLQPRNYELARALISALLANVGQAAAKLRRASPAGEVPGAVAVTVFGEVRDGQVRLTVRDPLPLITEWRCVGSTTLWLHEDLIEQGSSEGLTQHPIDPGNPNSGKEIRARWPVKQPALKLREIRR